MVRQRNHGLRKRCGCPRAKWLKCPHGWHFNFRWKGVNHRLSLDRECGRHIESKTQAQQEAERLRLAIRGRGDMEIPTVLLPLTSKRSSSSPRCGRSGGAANLPMPTTTSTGCRRSFASSSQVRPPDNVRAEATDIDHNG